MSTQKGLSPILIVLLIATVIGGYLFYSGKINLNQAKPAPVQQATQSSPVTADETANWKTYTALDNSYSFKYPDQWYVDNLCFFQIGVTPIHSTSGRLGNETLVTTEYSFARFDDEKSARYEDGTQVSTETTLNGKRLLRSKDLITADILINHLDDGKDRILNLRILDKSNSVLLDQILSTFKFLDQNQTGDTANWSTYTSPDNTFSFKYPNSWNTPEVLSQSTHTEYLFPESTFSVRVGFDYSQTLGRPLSFEEELEGAKKYANKVSQVTVGGIQAQEFVNASSTFVLILYGKSNITISITSNKTSDLQIFNQILSTFKFQ